MSETTEVKATETEAVEVTVFDELLSKTGLPDAALAPMKDKLVEAFVLVTEHNKRIIQVNAAKAQDPSNVDYLDQLWKANVSSDPALSEKAEEFYAVAETYERLIKELREAAVKFIPKVLSEEETKALRNLVNGSAPAIEKAIASARDMAVVVDNMLSLPHVNAKPEGGIMSLIPNPETLKNARGRKAANASGGERASYMTRVGDIQFDGKSTNITVDGEVKAKFNYAADAWNKAHNAEEFPENAITAVALEEAFFAHLGEPFRSIKGKDLPQSEYEFDFTHNVKEKSKQDGSETVKPVTVKVKVVKAESKAAPKVETATVEAPKASNESATPKTNNETLKPGDFIRPEPAKKTAASKAEPKK